MKKIASMDAPSKANDNPSVDDASPTPTPELGTAAIEPTPSSSANGSNSGASNGDASGKQGDVGAEAAPPNESRKFDPKRLRLNTDFGSQLSVTKHVLMVPIRKPNKFEWVQFKADETWRIQVATLIWKEDQEKHYVVEPELWASTPEIIPMLLVTTITTQGTVFFTPVRLPGPDGRHNEWHRTLFEGVHLGMEGKWVRFVANQSLGGYDVWAAAGDLGPPNWPATSFEKLLEVALRDRIIADREHPVLRRLRGEM